MGRLAALLSQRGDMARLLPALPGPALCSSKQQPSAERAGANLCGHADQASALAACMRSTPANS